MEVLISSIYIFIGVEGGARQCEGGSSSSPTPVALVHVKCYKGIFTCPDVEIRHISGDLERGDTDMKLEVYLHRCGD